MKVVLFSSKPYDKSFFEQANANTQLELQFLEVHLDATTAPLAAGHDVVCAFVNDELDAQVIGILKDHGVQLIAMRCAGYNNVDLDAARDAQIAVVRVPAYSPYAVAEHTLALILTLNRKTHRAHTRVREGNFSLDGLMGFDVHGKTAGVVGTGKIGVLVAKLLQGFGCNVLAHDPYPSDECIEAGIQYVELPELLTSSDIVTLHCPLTPQTHHMIDASSIAEMKEGVMLINTSRGGLVDTQAVIEGLKKEKIGYLGLDVYEEEGDLFFEDLSDEVIQDDLFARLTTFSNVLITGHQAYFTDTALRNIAETTLANIDEYARTGNCSNEVNS